MIKSTDKFPQRINTYFEICIAQWSRSLDKLAIIRQEINPENPLGFISCIESTFGFFIGLVIPKSYIEAARDWNGLLEHNIIISRKVI